MSPKKTSAASRYVYVHSSCSKIAHLSFPPLFFHSPSKASSAQKRSANDKNNAAGGNMQSQSTKQVSSFMLESVVTLISGVNLNLLLFLRMILMGMFFNHCSFLIIP